MNAITEQRAQSAALERQLRSQRALLQITRSILTTLGARPSSTASPGGSAA
jgi:hypothetical protein